MKSGTAFNGLICTSQTKTSITLNFLKQRFLHIPEDDSVVGFDDTPWTSLLWCPLTVISETTYKMENVAVNILLDKLEKKDTSPPKSVILEDEFIVRDSP